MYGRGEGRFFETSSFEGWGGVGVRGTKIELGTGRLGGRKNNSRASSFTSGNAMHARTHTHTHWSFA